MKTAGNSDSLNPKVTASVLDSTDFHVTVVDPQTDPLPLPQCIGHRFAHCAFREISPGQAREDSAETPVNHPAFGRSGDRPLLRPSPAVPEPLFDQVKMLDLAQKIECNSGVLFAGFVDFPAHMGQTGPEFDTLVLLGKRSVSGIPVTLQDATEVHRNEVLQTSRLPAGFPVINDSYSRTAASPQVASTGFPCTTAQIPDRALIDLGIAVTKDFLFDCLVNGLKPEGGQAHPVCQILTGQPDPVALVVDLFLPVEGQMVAVFGDNHLGDEAGSGCAALLQAGGQISNHRRRLRQVLLDVFVAHNHTAEKPGRFIVQTLRTLLANLLPIPGIGQNLLGFNDLFDNGKILRPAGTSPRSSLGFRALRGLKKVWSLLLAGGVAFSRRVVSAQEELHLVGTDCLAALAKNTTHQQIHLLAQKIILGPKPGIFIDQGGDLSVLLQKKIQELLYGRLVH